MAISYAQLKESPVILEPAEVKIEGMPDLLLVHQFTMNQMAELIRDKEGADEEIILRNQVLRFLNGFDFVPTDEGRKELGELFASWQLRELYHKAIRLNGFGPDALRDAQKN